jgi:hypothetical protein
MRRMFMDMRKASPGDRQQTVRNAATIAQPTTSQICSDRFAKFSLLLLALFRQVVLRTYCCFMQCLHLLQRGCGERCVDDTTVFDVACSALVSSQRPSDIAG